MTILVIDDTEFDELRIFFEEISIPVEEKGGPGSGHHGHAGRKGKVGGSVPDAGGYHHYTISPDENGNWDTHGAPFTLVGEVTENTIKSAQMIENALNNGEVPYKHIDGLTMKMYNTQREYEAERSKVTRDSSAIYIHDGDKIEFGNFFIESTVLHEIGHRVHLELLDREKYFDFIRLDKYVKAANMFHYKKPKTVENMGLRDYSFTGHSELMADCYKVWSYAKVFDDYKDMYDRMNKAIWDGRFDEMMASVED